MRISFDVDDTLVCYGIEMPEESVRFPEFITRRLCEPLRLGTRSLVNQLQECGFSVWIYTSSGRTPFRIRLWLFLHGVRVDGVVNEDRHRRELARLRFPRLPSKYPPAFGIDLHVDNSEGVRMEGDAHGFRVVVVYPEDQHWTQKVLDAVRGFTVDPSRCKLS